MCQCGEEGRQSCMPSASYSAVMQLLLDFYPCSTRAVVLVIQRVRCCVAYSCHKHHLNTGDNGQIDNSYEIIIIRVQVVCGKKK